eukprot:m.134370 g.134370  ORF g.134370 m.134370 type:complete len:325 (-) comp13957_c0_seq1:1061-2035(-)
MLNMSSTGPRRGQSSYPLGRARTPEHPERRDEIHGVSSRAIDTRLGEMEARRQAQVDSLLARRPNTSYYDPGEQARVGKMRQTMRSNTLLQKSELGRAPRPQQKQIETMRHGMTTLHSRTVADSMRWSMDQPFSSTVGGGSTRSPRSTGRSSRAASAPLDFVKMNKQAVSRGLVTPHEQKHMLQTEPIFAKQVEGKKPVKPKCVDPSQQRRAGLPSKSEEPISTIINDHHGRQWRRERMQVDKQEKQRAFDAQRAGFAMTKTAMLRIKHPEPPKEELWKMRKFQQKGPAVQSFRSPVTRDRAIQRHYDTAVDRLGVHKQGIARY